MICSAPPGPFHLQVGRGHTCLDEVDRSQMLQLQSSGMNGQRRGCRCLIGHRQCLGYPVGRLSFLCGPWCTILLLLCFLVHRLMLPSDPVMIQPVLKLVEQREPCPAGA